jgi:hypothetical protein
MGEGMVQKKDGPQLGPPLRFKMLNFFSIYGQMGRIEY